VGRSIKKKRKPRTRKLSDKQRLFIDKYFELSFDRTDAYLQAYPKVKSREVARVNAFNLLTNPTVFEEIEKRRAEAKETHKDIVERIIARLEDEAFSNIGDYLTFGPDGVQLFWSKDMTPEQLACVRKISERVDKDGVGQVSFELYNALDSRKELMKYLDMEKPQKHEVTGKDGAPLGIGFVNLETLLADIAAGYKPGKLWNDGDMPPQKEKKDNGA